MNISLPDVFPKPNILTVQIKTKLACAQRWHVTPRSFKVNATRVSWDFICLFTQTIPALAKLCRSGISVGRGQAAKDDCRTQAH